MLLLSECLMLVGLQVIAFPLVTLLLVGLGIFFGDLTPDEFNRCHWAFVTDASLFYYASDVAFYLSFSLAMLSVVVWLVATINEAEQNQQVRTAMDFITFLALFYLPLCAVIALIGSMAYEGDRPKQFFSKIC